MHYRLLSLGEAGLMDRGGEPIDFPLGKPFGILVYLALAHDPVPRDELAALFWPEGDRSRARHSLRQALSFLRQRLGEELFAVDDPVAVEPTVVETDIELLEESLRVGDVDRILERYRGPFLATVQLSVSPAWRHWVETQRRVLEERVAAALRDAAETAPAQAVELLRQVVEIEPHRVRHRRALVEQLLGRGELKTATAVLAESRQADLDDPDALGEMEARVRAVREGRRAAAERAEAHPEFVGRSAELASLTASWRSAMGGRRQVAVVTGPTGIGKTRLAEELALVAGAGGCVVHVKASAMEQRLEGSVTAELARALYRLPGGAGVGQAAVNVLRSLVPSLGGSGSAAVTGETPRPVAVSDALVDLASAVAYETPLLIVLDDMQWVDRSSLTLLLRMVRQIADEPVMVMLTFRSEEMGARDQAAVLALAGEENGSVIRLDTLSEAEVQEMLFLDLDESADRVEHLSTRLHEVTRGHPLFLVELLRSLREDDVLVPANGGWRFSESGTVELELPASVRTVIDRRLDRLGETARRLGAQLAALPPSAGLEQMRGRSGLTDAEFTAALNELVYRGVVTWDPSGRLVFTHDQLREAMADESVSRRRWHLAAAGLAAVFIVALVALAGAGESPARWGGGLILVATGDTLLAIDPAGAPDRWEPEPAGIWMPELVREYLSRFSVCRLTDGRVVWFGSTVGAVEPPEAVVLWGDEDRTDRHWPGDDNIRSVSPDGRYQVWATEHRGGDQYAKALRIVETGSGRTWPITGPASGVDARWSPQGTRVALMLSLARDSLLIIAPDGERLLTRSYYQIRLEDWCGPERVMIVARREPTSPLERRLIDVTDSTEVVLDTNVLNGAQCSPDGTAFVTRTFSGAGTRVVVTLIASGDRFPLPDGVASPLRLFWLPDSVPPIPEALVLRDSIRLVRGASWQPDVRVRLTDGNLIDVAPRWRSLEPAIVSIMADGLLAANRPGQARVVAEYAGWLTDTTVVTVVDGGSESLILADDFRTLDRHRWSVIGHPEPELAQVDGRPVLELTGDGRYSDGLITRRAAEAGGGFTVEFEFEAPQTAPEYQDFAVVIGYSAPPDDSTAHNHFSSWTRGEFLNFSLPAFELRKWSPDLVALRTGSGMEALGRLPDQTDLATWTHAAIQVQADGVATLWLDRQKVVDLRVPTTLLEQELRVAIFASTVDTHSYVRNFTWWAEPRYR